MNLAIGGRAGRLFLFVALLSCAGGVTAPRDLTFEERVAAQRAIERVYYEHQIGASRPFEEAVPDTVIRGKVETYLEQSLALERRWATPVTTKMLEAEMRRMAGGTRMPDRLRELHQALGNDPYLIRETLVRAALVDRLSRSFSAGGDPFGRGLQADTSEASVSGEVTAPSPGPAQAFISTQGGGAYAGEALSVSACVPDDTWDNGVLDDLPSARSLHTAVWTGSLVIIWGGGANSLQVTNTGSRYDPAIDSWSTTSVLHAPTARTRHTAVWTGSEMIVWGGQGTTYSTQFATGGRYDPISDTWAPLATDDAPAARDTHVAVWTGGLMLVWGGKGSGSGGRTDGGRYDPSSDTWTPIAMTGVPDGRIFNTAVWTGSEMIVWGGRDKEGTPSMALNTGARYNPILDVWTPVATAGAPVARILHTAVWSGSEMIVWGGYDDRFFEVNSGARYDPATDTWEPTSLTGAPDVRIGHSAVWAGNLMIIWGGVQFPGADFSVPLNSGGRYDPIADTWAPTSLISAPIERDSHTAVWTGNRMIVWGGHFTNVTIGGERTFPWDSGGRYDPVNDTWTPTSVGQGPAGTSQSVVWTGREMIVWGGRRTTGAFASTTQNVGGRYDPAIDSWTPTSLLDAPTRRERHTAVWTGEEMIVWGGSSGGGRYDPLLDTWKATTAVGAPSTPSLHTAVWSGHEMIVWGGNLEVGLPGTAWLYDPAADSWRSASTANAPVSRFSHTAVWTGEEMIVWGGRSGTSGNPLPFGDGSRYDPESDTWTTVNPFGAPPQRDSHAAVWTGDEMIIWGGRFINSDLNTGARYDPYLDVWTTVTTTGAPSARSAHTAVWTGDEMIVWAGTLSGNTGGRYDPQHDTWTATSTAGAPTPRTRHVAVWAGSHMIVWGGTGGEGTGGRYAIDRDGDDDGFTPCDGDCDDSDPAVNPDSAEVCNGIDDDCDASTDEEGDALCDDESVCTTDTCAGQDGCVNAPLPEGTLCPGGFAGGQCAAPDTCDAQGQCQVGLPVPAGIPCGNPDDTSCSNPDTCDGSGECGPNHEPDGTACSRRHGDDDDDDGHGDDDDDGHLVGGGHDDDDGQGGDDDDGGGDDHCDVCVAGECVRLDDEPHPPGDDDHDCDEDGVNDDAFDTLRLTISGSGSLSLSWDAPPVPQGHAVTGYRVWRRDRHACPWRLVAQTTTPGVTLPIPAGDGDAIYDVTAITIPPP